MCVTVTLQLVEASLALVISDGMGFGNELTQVSFSTVACGLRQKSVVPLCKLASSNWAPNTTTPAAVVVLMLVTVVVVVHRMGGSLTMQDDVVAEYARTGESAVARTQTTATAATRDAAISFPFESFISPSHAEPSN